MYQLTAVFNRAALGDVLQGLYDEQIEGITVMDVVGKGSVGGYERDLCEKVMIIIVLSTQEFKKKAMEAIRANTQETGHGAGKMWVTPVLEVERIRTGEKDAAALSRSTHAAEYKIEPAALFEAVDTPAS